MAQDILIAPGSGEPFIDFMATGVPSAIKLSIVSGVIPASGTSELSFEGTQGQLFSIADNLSSGTIFSVSDVTGLPLIEADASGDVKIAEFGRNVGVGSGVLPAYQLDVFGTGNFHQGIRFSDGTTQTTAFSTPISVANGGTNASSFADKAVLITQDSGTDTVAAAAMDANGELLIGGTSGPAVATLTQGSNMTITNADGGITLASSGGAGVSDEDLKENVTDLNINALDKVDELRTVEFDWNQTASDEFNGISGHDMGLIAQEVENVFPEFISEFRGRKTVDYPKLSVILIKAAQELKQEVESLKQEIEQLKNSQ
tara:strand:- start:146 stop:1093 length:948 start_codon:yes stop_codon:yes gene_type:complete